MEKRTFTLEEATELLSWLESRFEQLDSMRGELKGVQGEESDLLYQSRRNGEKSLDVYQEYNLQGWESQEKVFDSDADIVDHQVAIIEYENGATLAFHTNMKVPDEFRRFAIIGTKGMAEGDFVRGYLTAHDSHSGKKIFDKNFGAAFQQGAKGHYGADQLMVKDINNYLVTASSQSLPVNVIDCMQAGLIAMKIDEARQKNQIIDLRETWKKLDSFNL